ncbi:response regulator transcription factor [uncultured Arcobacter sp.]|uniref:response regulator transcription factor n=1 Tax=uncultured Arcobacter sp. TaxID=165434 RepID=UPI00261740BD|nr:response regulator transcription factor [uncultured Arcobacter sp.]
MKILLMEDDLILNEIIEEHLQDKGHTVISTYDANSAQNHLYEDTFDLLLLDVNVPGFTGFELLKELRDNGIKIPAIFITSLDMIDDVEKGFASGCDDYIKKPFELKELDLRINNIKRLFNIDLSTLKISENCIIDKENLMIIIENKNIHITQKELDVLIYLYNNKEKVVSIDELSLNLWSYEDSPSSATIRTYIKNLRKLLGENYILNIRGVGYRFNNN